jgi:hypothetical protein
MLTTPLFRKRRNKQRMNARGYLGPIGDDIPSLIPIVVGMITFFSAFSFTLNEYNQRSASFAADRDTLIIANSLKGDSYLSSFVEFDTACRGLRVRGLNYVAAVVESNQWNAILLDAQQDPNSHQLSFVADHVFTIGNTPLSCSRGIDSPFTSVEFGEILKNNQYVVLSLPVALEIPTAVVPGTLTVITWRAG